VKSRTVARRRANAHRRTLSNLQAIVAFAAIVRARALGRAGTVRGSLVVATSALRLEQLGAAPRGGIAAIVAAAEDRARRGVR